MRYLVVYFVFYLVRTANTLATSKTSVSKHNTSVKTRKSSCLNLYLPSGILTSQTHSMIGKKSAGESFGIRSRGSLRYPYTLDERYQGVRYQPKRGLQVDSNELRNRKKSRSTSLSAVSNSNHEVHGLLHPHTVTKLQERFDNGEIKSQAVNYFLDTYERFGPMACIPCLADPQVLPVLTEALRELD